MPTEGCGGPKVAPPKGSSVDSTGSSVGPASQASRLGAKSEPVESKFKELQEERAEILETIKDHEAILDNINKAKKLDSKLSESAKNQNTHLHELKEEYESIFDEDSGNSIAEGLENLKGYIKEERKVSVSMLKEVNSNIKNLTSSSTEDGNLKREGSDLSEDSKSKKPRNDDDKPDSSDSCPPSGPSSTPSSDGPSETSNNRNFSDNNYQIILFLRL